ncbi:MAG TPA: terminase TerL endonuclease subunit, partial [Tepidisphaeraceae bacterium]
LVKDFVFLPEDNVGGLFRRQKRDKAPYAQWNRLGHLTLTPGNVIDHKVIAEKIIELAEQYDLRELQIDPAGASAVTTWLMEAGVNVITVQQGWSLSPACKATDALIESSKLVHPDSPVLNWQMSNAVVHIDRRENYWLDKAKSTRRIDAAVAMVMAINAWKFGTAAAAPSNYYEKHPMPIILKRRGA